MSTVPDHLEWSPTQKQNKTKKHVHCLFLFQSDVIHQTVYELVHSEDREELQRQLSWSSFLSQDESANLALQDLLLPENSHLLERSFTVRFRCLLDNTSGFLVSSNIYVY